MAKRRFELEITGKDSSGQAFGSAEGRVSGFGGKLIGMGAIATAAGDLLSKGLQVGLDKAVELAQFLPQLGEQFDSVYDTIRIGTGATGEVFAGLQDNVRNLMGEIPLAMDQIGPSVDTLYTKLGLTGEGLEDVAGSAINLARLLGEDPTKSVEDIADVFNNWNVSASDMVPTLNMFLRTSQATGIGLGELTGGLTGAGLQMQEMGFSITEASALLGNLDKVGMSSSDVMSGMNRIMAEAATSGQPAAQMFRDLMSSLESGAPGAAAEAIEMLGTRSGGRFVAMVEQGKLAWDDLAIALGEGGDTIDGLAGETDDWREKWQLIKNEVFLALEGPAKAFFDGIGAGMDKLKDGDLSGAFDDWRAALGNAFGEVTGLWDQVWPMLQPELQKLGDHVKVWWDETGSPMVADAAGAAMGAAWDAVLAQIKQKATDPAYWGQLVENMYLGFFQFFHGNIERWGQTALSWTDDALSKLPEKMGGWWNAIGDWFGRLPGRIRGAVGNAADILLVTGRNIIIGLWNGLAEKAEWIKAKVGGLIKSVLPDQVEGLLGITSPSTVFHDIGVNTMLGLEGGILERSSHVASLIADLSARMSQLWNIAPSKQGEVDRNRAASAELIAANPGRKYTLYEDGSISFLAAGGHITGSGSVVVGDAGLPEIVDLPRGATVRPLDHVPDGEVVINNYIEINVEGSVRSDRDLLEMIRSGLYQKQRTLGVGLLP